MRQENIFEELCVCVVVKDRIRVPPEISTQNALWLTRYGRKVL